jgi:CheY-like chemotaxis protein
MRTESQNRDVEGVRSRVLVAEDDAIVRSWLVKTLEHEGLDVLAAQNGREAADLLATETVDLLLTDLWMPKMNGVELIESMDGSGWRLNAIGRIPEVVVLSAHLTAASTDKLRGLGVFATLTKPADNGELVRVVREGLVSDRKARLQREAGVASTGGRSTPADKASVLVADDDEGIRSLLARVLGAEGYHVVEAVDGEEAVEKALANDIDLVIMDLNMPRMNGIEAVAHLKRATRDCFIICATGECSRSEIDRVMQAGASSHFRKPFDVFELLAEVKRLDLIAAHRRKLAARERVRAEAQKRWSLADKTREWVQTQEHRFGRRSKVLLAIVAAILVAAVIAVPIVSELTDRAARAAEATAKRFNTAADAAGRVEGYLQRDEARELSPLR